MPPCVIRTKEGEGPWLPCPEPALAVDPDGDALCSAHMDKLWFCDCGGFNVAGNGMPCEGCQAERDGLDTTPFP
jgi:hypothetical protein